MCQQGLGRVQHRQASQDVQLLCITSEGLLLSTGAVEDFTIAVEQAPFFADGWKRRGQARSALGQNKEALEVQSSDLYNNHK